MPALEVHDLTKRYGAALALDGLSIAAKSGCVTAILGPNGAGKTTTIEICTGLQAADGGTVSVLDLDPHRDTAALRTRVAVMPQAAGSGAAGVYPSARPRETLRLYADFYANPLDPDALLDRLDLARVAGSPWRRLSGGEQQRLSLGLALIGRPELLFLDEPTSGLDPHAKRATWSLIDELRSGGVTVVLTTHAMDEAQHLADDVVIVDRGRVVASGTPAELTADGRSLEAVFLDLTGTGAPLTGTGP